MRKILIATILSAQAVPASAQECSYGFVPTYDSQGQLICMDARPWSEPEYRYYYETGCPMGYIAGMNAQGEPFCRHI